MGTKRCHAAFPRGAPAVAHTFPCAAGQCLPGSQRPGKIVGQVGFRPSSTLGLRGAAGHSHPRPAATAHRRFPFPGSALVSPGERRRIPFGAASRGENAPPWLPGSRRRPVGQQRRGSQSLYDRPCQDRKVAGMPGPTGAPKRLMEYIEHLQAGLDALGARLEACERVVAAIEKHLVPEKRSEPGVTGPLHSDKEGGNHHA